MTIDAHIEQIRTKLKESGSLPESTRAELLELLTSLEGEVKVLSETHQEEAVQVARTTAASTEAATGEEPETLKAALKDLTGSVEGLEASHPEVVQVVNRIALTLSNMGI